MVESRLHGHVDGDRSDDVVGGQTSLALVLAAGGLRSGEGGVVSHQLRGFGVLVSSHGGVAVVRVPRGRSPVARTHAVRRDGPGRTQQCYTQLLSVRH